MALHRDANFRIRNEITLQRFNLPAVGANGLNCHRIYIGGDASQQKCRTDKITRNQFPEGMPVSLDSDIAFNNELDRFRTLATF